MTNIQQKKSQTLSKRNDDDGEYLYRRIWTVMTCAIVHPQLCSVWFAAPMIKPLSAFPAISRKHNKWMDTLYRSAYWWRSDDNKVEEFQSVGTQHSLEGMKKWIRDTVRQSDKQPKGDILYCKPACGWYQYSGCMWLSLSNSIADDRLLASWQTRNYKEKLEHALGGLAWN